MQPLTIAVISDFVCPWCYIGRRRLQAAIADIDPARLAIRYFPYELNPWMPAEGVPRDQYRVAKFGSLERSAELDAQVSFVASEEGLSFALEDQTRTPSTFAAHRLVWLAQSLAPTNDMTDEDGRRLTSAAVADTLIESLFAAYFEQGEDIGDAAVLERLARDAGMSDEGLALWREGGAADDVRAIEAQGQKIGIPGVPFFIIGDTPISGAHPADMLRSAIDAELRSLAPTRSETD